jgi:hypothetical protein
MRTSLRLPDDNDNARGDPVGVLVLHILRASWG